MYVFFLLSFRDISVDRILSMSQGHGKSRKSVKLIVTGNKIGSAFEVFDSLVKADFGIRHFREHEMHFIHGKVLAANITLSMMKVFFYINSDLKKKNRN